jgi:hypothetical protein
MPRSGTTLVDRTLSQHPRVETAGERRTIQALVREHGQEHSVWFPSGFDTLNKATLDAIAQRYRREVLESREDADWVIDKEPENFRYLAIIAAAFPEAVILHVEREPADTCLSCYMQDFTAPLSYANGLADLGHYYRLYSALMDHWRSILPEQRLLAVRYEAWVQDLPNEASRVLNALGLSWDPACADFHRSSQPVRTASIDQVRRPVYSESVGRWQAYCAYLEPLFTALGPLAPEETSSSAS